MTPEEEDQLVKALKDAAAGKPSVVVGFPAMLTPDQAKQWLAQWRKGQKKRKANAKKAKP